MTGASYRSAVFASLRLRPSAGAGLEQDGGSTLLVAVSVAALAMGAGILVVSTATVASQDSGVDRQRALAIAAAEGGIAAAHVAIAPLVASFQFAALPCALPATSYAGYPDQATVTTTLTYQLGNGVERCPLQSGEEPVAATVRATAEMLRLSGSTRTVRRTMVGNLVVRGVPDGKGYAIFSNSAFAVPQSYRYLEGTAPADTYVQGNFTCENAATVGGTVSVPNGWAKMTSSCVVAALEARDSLYLANTASVTRNAYSSRGSVTLENSSRVGADVTAGGTFSKTGTATVGGSVRANLSGLSDPRVIAFPSIGWRPNDWIAAGFTVRDYGTDCSRIKAEWLTVTSPTAFYGDCGIDYSGENGLRLKTDVALVLTRGFRAANTFELASDTTSVRKLWIIDPVTSSPAICTAPSGVSFSNYTYIQPDVNVFLYSDCSVHVANNATFSGQVYGAHLSVSNNFNASFVSNPPPGVFLDGPLVARRADLVSTFETKAP